MRTVGLFEAKTKFSELCGEVADTGQPVVVTRRGIPLVRIEPETAAPLTIRERRAEYVARHGAHERKDARDFEVPVRSRETTKLKLP